MRCSKANITNRIEAIDMLRGVALLGITFRHFLSRFNYEASAYSDNLFLAQIDKFIRIADYHFLTGKMYPIFALLFGFSIFLVSRSFGTRSFAHSSKRLLGLIPFACLNAAFFPDGDILGLYVIVGFIVLLLIRLPRKWVLYLAGFFLLQPSIWIQGIVHFFDGNINITEHNFSLWIRDVNHTIANGSFLEIMWVNLTKGQIGNFLWAVEIGRVSQTIGLMLLGYHLGESGRLVSFIGKGKKVLYYLLIPVLVIIGEMIFKKFTIGTTVPKELLIIISNWSNLAFAYIYVILIIYVYSLFPSYSFSSLRFYGRMSLTNYVLQSMIGGILFAPFAFNGAAYLSNISVALLFTITIFAQMIFSKYWLTLNQYGPLEIYWRKFIYTNYNRLLKAHH